VKGGNFTGLAPHYQPLRCLFLRFSAVSLSGEFKSLDRYTIYDVAVDNFINIFFINKRIPDTLRIDHANRSFLTTVKTPRLVYPHFSLPTHSQFLDPALCVITQSARSALIAGWAIGVRPAIIGAEKQMSLVVRGHVLSIKQSSKFLRNHTPGLRW
jgi:hypothetical protein